jgi:hypothetical protein
VKVLHEVFNMERPGYRKTIYCKFSFVEVTLQTSLRKIWKGMLHSFQSYLNLKSKTYQHCRVYLITSVENLQCSINTTNHVGGCNSMSWYCKFCCRVQMPWFHSWPQAKWVCFLIFLRTEMNSLYLVIYSWWRLPQSRADAAASGHF